MSGKSRPIASILETTSDYRGGAPTAGHVKRWLRQFDKEVRGPILREMDHVLKRTYFSRRRTKKFLANLFQHKKLVDDDPRAFWKGVKLLDIQGGGASQKEMLALFGKILNKKCGFGIADCGADPHSFIYLDDAIFTGSRIRRDLEPWVTNHAGSDATIYIATIALHKNGKSYAESCIKNTARNAGKRVKLKWGRAVELEDRKQYTNWSDVLRPVVVPDDPLVAEYVDAMSYKPHLRAAGGVGRKGIFSSDEGRQVLEQEFLKAGVRIRDMCPYLNEYQRPLGNSILETPGFGSLIVTFRNCPNNAPPALWAGDPWYPLFRRTTNTETALR